MMREHLYFAASICFHRQHRRVDTLAPHEGLIIEFAGIAKIARESNPTLKAAPDRRDETRPG